MHSFRPFLILMALPLGASITAAEPIGTEAPPILSGGQVMLQTALPNVQYIVSYGEFDSTEEGLAAWLARHPDLGTLTITAFQFEHPEYANFREPQQIGARLMNFADAVAQLARSARAKSVEQVRKIKERYARWLYDDLNRLRLKYTLISVVVDGVATSSIAVFLQNVTVPAALAMGLTMSMLSGSWSFYTPKLAEFFDGKISLIRRLTRNGRTTPATLLDLEGLGKWFIVMTGYLFVFQFASMQYGAIDPESAFTILKTAAGGASLSTLGNGLYDFALSLEFNKKKVRDDDSKTTARALERFYIYGTAAASLNIAASAAHSLGSPIGGYALYALLVAGGWKYLQIRGEEIRALFAQAFPTCSSAAHRKTGIRSPKPYESWGSE